MEKIVHADQYQVFYLPIFFIDNVKGYRPKSSLKVYFRYVTPFLWLKPWIKLFLGKTIHNYLELL